MPPFFCAPIFQPFAPLRKPEDPRHQRSFRHDLTNPPWPLAAITLIAPMYEATSTIRFKLSATPKLNRLASRDSAWRGLAIRRAAVDARGRLTWGDGYRFGVRASLFVDI